MTEFDFLSIGISIISLIFAASSVVIAYTNRKEMSPSTSP